MTSTLWQDALARFAGQRILVIGDMVADEHIFTRASGISREAPLPVLQYVDRKLVPGGATNVARNIRALGAEVWVSGVIGNDPVGHDLRQLLEDDGIHCSDLIAATDRATSTKTRIWAGGDQQPVQQQVCRIDRVERAAVAPELCQQAIAGLNDRMPKIDAAIISDYEISMVDEAIIENVLRHGETEGKPVTVDSHGDLARFKSAAAFTPNQPEVEFTLGRTLHTIEELEAAGAALLELLDSKVLLITRGSEGMSLFAAGAMPYHMPALGKGRVIDPTGAGDTVSAVLTLALLVGLPPPRAAMMAAAAASIVVRKLGAAVAMPAEILSELATAESLECDRSESPD
jgi:rfaE bifunctional protein kinase chain/domain